MTYYDRSKTTFIDGTPIFKTEEDERNEDEISKIIEKKWECTLHSFGRLSPIDWYAIRDGRMLGVLELKSRTHASDKFKTVFLNVRKWLALQLASTGMGVPAAFVVKFTDCTKYIYIQNINANKVKIGGLTSIVKSRNDIEPLIEVDVSKMETI
jgi:hypothetical protein